MSNMQAIEILPPIVLGVGALVPFVVRGMQSGVNKRNQLLAGTCAFAIAWFAFFIVQGFSPAWHYSHWLTLISCALAAALLTRLLLMATRTSTYIKSRGALISYLACVALLTIASTNIIKAKGATLFEIQATVEPSDVFLVLPDFTEIPLEMKRVTRNKWLCDLSHVDSIEPNRFSLLADNRHFVPTRIAFRDQALGPRIFSVAIRGNEQ